MTLFLDVLYVFGSCVGIWLALLASLKFFGWLGGILCPEHAEECEGSYHNEF